MKILMVCLGNICRSPLSEGVLRKKLNERGIKEVLVDSCGTSNYHIGETPDKRTQQNALMHNVDLSKLKARQFKQSDFDEFDEIYVMDLSNKNDVLELARNKEDEEKVDLLLNLIYPNENMSVPDPYFGGESGFEDVFQLVDEACNKLIEQIIE